MAKEKAAKVKKPHLVRKSIGLFLALVLGIVVLAVNLVVLPMFGGLADKLMSTSNMDLDSATREATHAEAIAAADQI